MSGAHLSREFFEFIKSIGESRSKTDEDKIVLYEVANLKQKLTKCGELSNKQLKELLIRCLYVEMLGHEADFSYIHAIKLTNSKNLNEKRIGYLIINQVLNPKHSFILLLINTLQNDLKSENLLQQEMALNVVCRLLSSETIPTIQPLIMKLIDHKDPIVKRKAILALLRMYALDEKSIDQNVLFSIVRKCLCDSSISVLSSTLCLLEEITQRSTTVWKDLIPELCSIFLQIIENRLPSEYNYHKIPAPWLQFSILKILSQLGKNDKSASEQMYEILSQTLRKADLSINICYAIIYECIRTISKIYPDKSLLEECALFVSKFLSSDNCNLKVFGINSLTLMTAIDPIYAAEHQLTVIDCLEDNDETLKRKTLDLLYSMTNPSNCNVIIDRLITYLKQTNDSHLKRELIEKIYSLAERFISDQKWFIETFTSVLNIGGPLVKPAIAHNLVKLIANNEDVTIKSFAFETFFNTLRTHTTSPLPDILIQIAAYIVGNQCTLSHQKGEKIINLLLGILSFGRFNDLEATQSSLLIASVKVAATFQLSEETLYHLNLNLKKYTHSIFFLFKPNRT